MASNILFVFGEDKKGVFDHARELSAKFCDKHGDHNFEKMWGDQLDTFAPLQNALDTMPFLGDRRMVLLRDPWNTRKTAWRAELADFLDEIPASTILLIVETTKPDKREALFKRLLKKAQVFEMVKQTPAQLAKQAVTLAQQFGSHLELPTATFLVERVDADSEKLANEIQKLALAADGDTITRELILEMTPPADPLANIFALTDALGTRNLSKSLRELQQLFENGENEFYLLATLAGHWRNLLLVRDLLDRNPAAAPRAATELKLHPFVAKKALTQARNFEFAELRDFYAELAALDVALKTGAKTDPKLELERFCLRVCRA